MAFLLQRCRAELTIPRAMTTSLQENRTDGSPPGPRGLREYLLREHDLRCIQSYRASVGQREYRAAPKTYWSRTAPLRHIQRTMAGREWRLSTRSRDRTANASDSQSCDSIREFPRNGRSHQNLSRATLC